MTYSGAQDVMEDEEQAFAAAQDLMEGKVSKF